LLLNIRRWRRLAGNRDICWGGQGRLRSAAPMKKTNKYFYTAVLQLWLLIAVFFTSGLGLAFRVVHLGFVVINSALVHVFFSKNVGFSCNYHVISRPYWCICNWGWALGLLDIAVREDAVRLKKNASVLRGTSSFDLCLRVVWTNLPPTTAWTIVLCVRIEGFSYGCARLNVVTHRRYWSLYTPTLHHGS